LSAARVLARAGLNVTVIEARNRVGGRVWTLRSFADDLHGELGGEFIDADQNDIRALCAELGLPLIRILRTGFVHRFRGDDGRYRLNRRRLWRDLAQWLAPLLAAYKHAQGEVSSYAVREMAAISLREWLRRGHARPEVHSMADALRGFFLADPDDLSVLPVVEQLATGGTPAQSPVYRVAGGTDALAAAMANTLVAPVMLQHRLRAIAQSAVGVTATVTMPRDVNSCCRPMPWSSPYRHRHCAKSTSGRRCQTISRERFACCGTAAQRKLFSNWTIGRSLVGWPAPLPLIRTSAPSGTDRKNNPPPCTRLSLFWRAVPPAEHWLIVSQRVHSASRPTSVGSASPSRTPGPLTPARGKTTPGREEGMPFWIRPLTRPFAISFQSVWVGLSLRASTRAGDGRDI
jgi:Flavin containing amine oxidoreductase